MKILLKPVAQVAPNIKGIVAPSRISNPIAISQEEFASVYADTAQARQVSFSEDGKSDPRLTTTYTASKGPNRLKGSFIIK